MRELIESDTPDQAGADPLSIQLGQWMGRREAFGLMAGRCSAADIEILRRIKEEKLYAGLNCTWSEFCARHLHVNRRTADREIGYLHEFGPAFFTIRQLTHLGLKDYQAIAPQISEHGVNLDGQVIPLLPENSEPLTAAVEELLQRSGTARRPAMAVPFDALLKQCRETRSAVRAFPEKLSSIQMFALSSETLAICDAAASLEHDPF